MPKKNVQLIAADGGILIQAGGAEHRLDMNFASLRQLGLTGAGDWEGLQRVLQAALQDWHQLVKVIAAGGAAAISLDDLNHWKLGDVRDLISAISASLGFESTTRLEGEQSGPPASLNRGSNAGPSPDTTSA